MRTGPDPIGGDVRPPTPRQYRGVDRGRCRLPMDDPGRAGRIALYADRAARRERLDDGTPAPPDPPPDPTVIHPLAIARESARLTRAELADALGVAASTVQAWEQWERAVPTKHHDTIRRVTGYEGEL